MQSTRQILTIKTSSNVSIASFHMFRFQKQMLMLPNRMIIHCDMILLVFMTEHEDQNEKMKTYLILKPHSAIFQQSCKPSYDFFQCEVLFQKLNEQPYIHPARIERIQCNCLLSQNKRDFVHESCGLVGGLLQRKQ